MPAAAGRDSRANDILDSILGSSHSANFPNTVYVAAYSVAPDRVTRTGGTEYGTRVAVANTDAEWSQAANRRKHNVNRIDFPTPSTDTPDFIAVAVHGHITDDDIIFLQLLAQPIRALANEPLYIPAEILILAIP